MVPSARMETVSGWFWLSMAPASVFGSWIGTPAVSSGAEIMKMISSTSITSTSGVTLISESARRLRPRRRPRRWLEESSESGIAGASSLGPDPLAQAAGDRGGKLFGEPFEAAGELARVGRELVVGDVGRDGGGETDGGREQRFGDRRRDHREVGVLLHRDRLEGVHDAPD